MRNRFQEYPLTVKAVLLKGIYCKFLAVIILEKWREIGSHLKGPWGGEWIWGRS